jgi:uncharacterized membrane protein YqgA involved in biofilm formation
VTGAILNAAGIVVGGVAGLIRTKPLRPATQAFLRTGLGVFTIYFGLRLTWLSVNGPFPLIVRQLAIALLAVLLGKWAGHLLRLQRASNRLGGFARSLIEKARSDDPHRVANGFNACAVLFCAAPLGFLGAVQEGLTSPPYFYTLAVKAVMDGLAMLGFAKILGSGALLSALPVFALQAAVTLACNQHVEPFLRLRGLTDSVNAVGGLIVCTIGLVIFEVKKVELADFLPALALAPLLTWLWR